MSDFAFYQLLFNRLQAGPVVLATVIATQGVETIQAGTKMLIWGDAETAGSLGNGVNKIQVMQAAFEVLKTGIAQRLRLAVSAQDFALETASDFEPSSNTATLVAAEKGTLQVWLTRWQGADAISTAQAILDSFQQDQRSRLVIPLTTGLQPYVLSGEGPSLRNLQGQEAYIELLQQ